MSKSLVKRAVARDCCVLRSKNRGQRLSARPLFFVAVSSNKYPKYCKVCVWRACPATHIHPPFITWGRISITTIKSHVQALSHKGLRVLIFVTFFKESCHIFGSRV